MQETVLTILPQSIRKLLDGLPPGVLGEAEELRLREGRPLELVLRGRHVYVSASGALVEDGKEGYIPDRMDCHQLLDILTNHSVYTLEEELRRGYITVKGGHRVGISGKAVLDKGAVKQLRDISSFNIRIARELRDAAKPLLPKLLDVPAGTIHHTLVISPPQQGKTTLIRDMARLISSGEWNIAGMPRALKVGIVDERSEIAAVVKGVPSFDVGPRTDVLDSCPKAEGMMMMIRSMSPDVLIVDEIGRPEDANAIHEALRAGIRVIATAHGLSFEDIRSRPMLKELMQEQVFSRYVVLGHTYGIGRIYRIYDSDGRMMDSVIARNSRYA